MGGIGDSPGEGGTSLEGEDMGENGGEWRDGDDEILVEKKTEISVRQKRKTLKIKLYFLPVSQNCYTNQSHVLILIKNVKETTEIVKH